MKKLSVKLFLIIGLIVLCSCSNENSKGKKTIIEYLSNNLINPETIDVLEQSKMFKITDSKPIGINDEAKHMINGCSMAISTFQHGINMKLEDINPPVPEVNEESVKEWRNTSRNGFENCISSMDSICISNKIQPLYYAIKCKIRVKNSKDRYNIMTAWFLLDNNLSEVKQMTVYED